ncbi:MAB_1171c family putative transporter [Streptomyces sp. G45]|uniref:MAB_1171c family putative transporter n=1 Tax=Streptomyces sp. G45 TaxID=3406627 RepID=UPI003C13B7F5
MSTQSLHAACAVVAWLAFGYKLNALRKAPRDSALIALCGALLFAALGYTVSHPSVYEHVDRALGLPNSAALLALCCIVTMLTCQQLVLIFWAHPPAAARRKALPRVLAALIVQGALVNYFLMTSPSEQDFSLRNASNVPFAVFLCAYFPFFTVADLETGRMSWDYAKVSHRLWLRRGLRLVAVGAWVSLTVVLVRALGVCLYALPVELDLRRADLITRQCADVGALVLYVGWTVPGWGPALSAPGRWLRARRQYRQLRPLHTALGERVPSVVLAAPANGPWGRLRPSHLEFKVYRQVIEIRDCQLALRPYADPRVVRAAAELGGAAGLGGRELQALEEAAELASMLRSRSRGAAPAAERAPRAASGPQGSGLAAEIDWLVTVAQAVERSPHLAAALARTAPDATDLADATDPTDPAAATARTERR